VVGGGLAHVPREASGAVDPHLRFQLPESVLPMQVERIRLVGQLDARLRQLTISGKDGETFVEIHRADDVLGPLQIELAEQRFLQLDARGGLANARGGRFDSIVGDGLSVVAGRQQAQNGFAHRYLDRPDPAVAENELANARVVAAEPAIRN
jgi:hypothetical protein